MPVVLLTDRIHPEAWARLEQEAEVRLAERVDEDGLAAAIADADALLVRNPITPRVLAAGRKLKVVARHGVGLDYIPMAEATARGIPVTFTPDANTESVAEYVVGGMIALAHRFGEADRMVREGRWGDRGGLAGCDLKGRTLGIVGFGRIGRRVAEICRLAFAMTVLVHTRSDRRAEIRQAGAEPCGLDEVLAGSEFLTLHVPLSAETRNLIDAAAIARMRPGALLINAARGGVVDCGALLQALDEGRLGGAMLDVFPEEPPRPNDPLLRHPRLLLTPHSAALTEEALRAMGMTAAEDILRVLRGDAPLFCANRAGGRSA